MKRHHWILLGLIGGVLAGAALHPYQDTEWAQALQGSVLAPIGQIFLRLIFMVVVPLVFSALILGVLELGQGDGLKRVASRTFLYTLIASSLSVLIGITLVNWLQPGVGVQVMEAGSLGSEMTSQLQTIQKNASSSQSFSQAIVELIPKNPLLSATQALSGEMLPLMVFALIFGVAIARRRKEQSATDGALAEGPRSALIPVLQEVFETSMRIVEYAMRLAPLAVFSILTGTVMKQGFGVLTSIGFYVGVVILGLLLQQFVVYSALLKWIAKRNPWTFFQNCREVYLQAFSTASSNATLPLTLETAEKKLGLSPKISRFVLTVGATANQNGTALFEGVTILFLAQVYGVELGISGQIKVVLMSILAGIGTAGVPGGSLPLIVILLQSLGIPAEGVGLILGADRFLDMCRTTLNVSGDLVITALVDSTSASSQESRT